MKQLLFTLWKGQRGRGLTEYALLMVLVALVAVAATYSLGDKLREQLRHAGRFLGAGL
jgi:Flp pilus assembly pilin Flp